jgi:hypothetical protein
LVLASSTEVTSKALAQALVVVTDTSARAISTSFISFTEKNIAARRTFLERTVRSSVSQIANASNMLKRIPGGVVCCTGFAGELFFSVANTSVVTVRRTDGSFAGDTVVVLEAIAFSGLSVADTLIRAFYRRMGSICTLYFTNPSVTFGASSLGTVMGLPSVITVGSGVTSALVVFPTRAMPRASIRAVSISKHEESSNDGNEK